MRGEHGQKSDRAGPEDNAALAFDIAGARDRVQADPEARPGERRGLIGDVVRDS